MTRMILEKVKKLKIKTIIGHDSWPFKNLKKIMNNYILELKAPDFRRGFAADLYSAIEEAATNKKTEKSPDEKKPKKAQKKKKGRVIFST